MSTCADCVHYEVCRHFVDLINPLLADHNRIDINENTDICKEHFKARSRFVELPVKISDKYYMDIKQAKTVSNMLLTISQNFEYNGDNSSAFKSYFIGVGDAIESCLKVLTTFWKEKK